MKIISVAIQLFCCGIVALPLVSDATVAIRFLAFVDIATFWTLLVFVGTILCEKDSSC